MNSARSGLMVLFACHCVFDRARNCIYAEHPEDRPIYEAQLAYAFRHLTWRKPHDPLLILSGAPSKSEVTGSESQTNLDLAEAIGLEVPGNVACEEYALTSVDNLVLSLFRYHMLRHAYPEKIDVISWGWKQERFEASLEAVNGWSRFGESWTSLSYFPVGDLAGVARQRALAVEREYIESLQAGVETYYASPIVQEMIRRRDAHNSRSRAGEFYSGYPVPFQRDR
jgi:hypothetical protein